MATSTTVSVPLIGINSLAYYIKRICTFIESDKKSLSFPNISEQLQNVLKKISTESIDFLNSDEYSNVKMEVLKLAAVMKANANVKLTHEICDGSNVLMYKKTKVNTFKVPETLPLRKPSVSPAATIASPLHESVTQIFKTNCLNAVTKFVKDDSRLVMKCPEMLPAQAQFVIDMILPGKDSKPNKDVCIAYRNMYAPLWESMRVFSLKYDYRIDYDTKPTTREGMKRVVFEKIPKWKPIEVMDLENPDSPEIIVDLTNEDSSDDSCSSSSSTVSLNNSKVYQNSKSKTPKSNCPNKSKRIEKLIRKLGLRIQKGLITKTFVHDVLQRTSEFLFDNQLKSIEFKETSEAEQYFLANVKKLSCNASTYMLFNSECQRFLDDIKYCFNVKNIQYEIKYAKGVVKSNKASLKTLSFEKISSKASDSFDEEASTPANLSFSSTSATSVSTKCSDSQKRSKLKNQPVEIRKKKAQKLINHMMVKLRNGNLDEELIETTLRRIYEFMYDDQQGSIIFQPINVHHLHFIQKVGHFAREDETYGVFSNECWRLLERINDCFKKNMTFQVRQIKGRKDVVLEKLVNFNSSSAKSALEKISPSKAADSDVEMNETLDSSFSSQSTSSVNFNNSGTSLQSNSPKVNKTVIKQLQAKMRCGVFTNEFIETTLQRICDFMYNGKQTSLVFKDVSSDNFGFINHVDSLALDVDHHSVFRSHSRKLLEDLHRCFERGMLYRCTKNIGRNGIEVIMKKLGGSTKELKKDRENDENTDNTNTPACMSRSNQDLLTRLRAIKEKVVATCGKQCIIDYLQDISNFLAQSNTDRCLTFDDLTENEAVFIKHIHVMSKLEEGYPIFSRECQKLLKSIQFNAQAYTLKCQAVIDADNNNSWTVVITKQFASGNEKVVQRARSLSVGRRRRQITSDAKTKPRDISCQRLGVKEKLKAGLAQPVHSDIAVRMMENMGWTGGALGVRGDGITEPISLPLDLAKRAGLGHVPKAKKPKPEPKPKEPKKTKPVKQEAASQLPPGFHPVNLLPTNLIPPGIVPIDSLKNNKTIVLGSDYRVIVLRNILELITTEVDEMYFICTKNPQKIIGFLKHAVTTFNGRFRFELADEMLKQLVAEIAHIFDSHRAILLKTEIRNKTHLLNPIVVVKKLKLIPILPKKKIKDQAFIRIEDRQETNDQASKTNDQYTTNRNEQSANKDSTYREEPITYTDQSIWHQTQKTSGRQWYSPVKSKRKQKTKKIQKLKVMENIVPELKSLALSAVSLLDIKTDDYTTKIITDNQSNNKLTKLACKDSITQQDTVKQRELSKNSQDVDKVNEIKRTRKSKLIVKVPNMTRKQCAMFNCKDKPTDIRNERTTYILEVEQYKTNKILHTNVKATKNNSEMNSRRARRINVRNTQVPQILATKTQQEASVKEQQKAEYEKSPGVLLLEKLIVNNNNSTMNKNTLVNVKKEKVTAKSSVAIRLQNAAMDNDITVKPEKESMDCNITVKKEKESLNNNVPIADNVTSTMNNIAAVTNNNIQLTTNLSKTESICKRNSNIKIVDNGDSNNCNIVNENEVNSVTYIIPLENQLTVETNLKSNMMEIVQNENIVTINNSDLNQKFSLEDTPKTNNENENDLYDVDDDYQIIFDDSHSSNKNVPIANNVTSTMNNIAAVTDNNNTQLTTNLSETESICERNSNIKIVDNGDSNNCNIVNENGVNSGTYITPVENQLAVETKLKSNMMEIVQNENIVTINNSDLNQNCSLEDTPKTNNENENDLYDVDDDCQIIFDDSHSSILINSDDEGALLISDDEVEVQTNLTVTNNLTEDVASKQVIKDNETNRYMIEEIESFKKEPQENTANDLDNGSDNYFESENIQVVKRDSQRASIQERKRPSHDHPKSISKKSKLLVDYKKIHILPKDYPKNIINSEKASEIQTALLKCIDYTRDALPLLRCHGIQNGELIYSCQDEKSLSFLEYLVQQMDNLRIVYECKVEEKTSHKMAFRINSFIKGEPAYNVLNRLELYNSGLNSTQWSVVKSEQHGDYSVIFVDIDEVSFNYICESNFVLYAGNDCARFTVVWD